VTRRRHSTTSRGLRLISLRPPASPSLPPTPSRPCHGGDDTASGHATRWNGG